MSAGLLDTTPIDTYKLETVPGEIPTGAPTEITYADDSLVASLATAPSGNRSAKSRPGVTVDGAQTSDGPWSWDFAANAQTDAFMRLGMRNAAGFTGPQITADVGIDVTATGYHGVGKFVGYVPYTLVYVSGGVTNPNNNGWSYITAATDDDITVADWRKNGPLTVEAAGAPFNILGQILDDDDDCETIRIEREHVGDTGDRFTGFPLNVVTEIAVDAPDDGLCTFTATLAGGGTDGHTPATKWDTLPAAAADFSKGKLHHATRHVDFDAIIDIGNAGALTGAVTSSSTAPGYDMAAKAWNLTYTTGLTPIVRQGKEGAPFAISPQGKGYAGAFSLLSTNGSVLPGWLYDRRDLAMVRIFCPPDFAAETSGATAYAFIMNNVTVASLGDRPPGGDADTPLMITADFTGDNVSRGGVKQDHFLRIVKFTHP